MWRGRARLRSGNELTGISGGVCVGRSVVHALAQIDEETQVLARIISAS